MNDALPDFEPVDDLTVKRLEKSVALSDKAWLTDALEWDTKIDVPFLPGVRSRISEIMLTPWPWDIHPKRGFKVWRDEAKSAVIVTLRPGSPLYICSDHDNHCDCKKIVARYLETDPK